MKYVAQSFLYDTPYKGGYKQPDSTDQTRHAQLETNSKGYVLKPNVQIQYTVPHVSNQFFKTFNQN